MATAARWGTWEELLLGGAVLRHGAAAWDAVAAELQARTPFPHLFSAQVCETKFEELQKRYLGSDVWFEELRKRRVAELKKELEKSEDSIGFLHAKLESLSSHGESRSNSEFDMRLMISESPTEKACDNDSFGRDLCKDTSSAGSFTLGTHGDQLSTRHIVDSISPRDNQLKIVIDSDRKDKTENLTSRHVSYKRKRGKRKRRFSIIVKEGSTGECKILSPVACTDRTEVINGCKVDGKTTNRISCSSLNGELKNMDVRATLDSILENKDVSVFQSRLESQKKPRYKKVIRRHVDLMTIRKGILNSSISSMRDLFRELLLLSNNAFVFYPKDSAEYKSALAILELAKMKVGKNSKPIAWSPDEHDISGSVVKEESADAAGIRPCNQNGDKKMKLPFEGARPPKPQTNRKRSHVDTTVESLTRKRAIGRRPVKEGHKNGKNPDESSKKGKKRARRS